MIITLRQGCDLLKSRHLRLEKKKVCLTVEYYSSFKKGGNPAICENMDEPGGYYTHWSNAISEAQILHSTYMSYLTLSDS